MTEKRYLYSNKKKNSKKPAIIIISIVAALVIIVATVILLFPFLGDSSNIPPFATHPSITERTQETTQVTVSEQPTTEKAENTTSKSEQDSSTQNIDSEESSNIQKATEESITMQSSNSESVVVPGDVDDATYFSATYSPYKAVDSETDEQCSLKEVFGSSYVGGSVTFNSDGSFFDALTTSSSNNGSYAVKDSKLIATYSNDRNMDVSVSSWNGDTPSEIIINYGGYYVYLS
ncbi:MAG: hypothetical protein J1E85_05245 [Ruminococcus sp.]|nr:hypothetical protein [Ruminococcus sp.]